MLADDPSIVPLGGGTDLLVHWPDRHAAHAATYVDLGRIAGLRAHRWTDDALLIGATTTYWDLIRDPRTARELPLLVEAGRLVGAVQIQSRGTWAGNIVNASPAADGVPVMMAYDAVVVLEEQQVPGAIRAESQLPRRLLVLAHRVRDERVHSGMDGVLRGDAVLARGAVHLPRSKRITKLLVRQLWSASSRRVRQADQPASWVSSSNSTGSAFAMARSAPGEPWR